MTGKTIGLWTVIKQSDKENGKIYWLCKCKCGTERTVLGTALRAGVSKGCGCHVKHTGFSLHPMLKYESTEEGTANYLYRIWINIKSRVFNKTHKNYNRYGERGITLYKDWIENYPAFRNYIRTTLGEKPSNKHSLDRINNNGNYEPNNLRWATPLEQRLNQF